MIKRLITHIKRWNKWRKHCANGWLHKIAVLFDGGSPTFQLTLTDEEIWKWAEGGGNNEEKAVKFALRGANPRPHVDK